MSGHKSIIIVFCIFFLLPARAPAADEDFAAGCSSWCMENKGLFEADAENKRPLCETDSHVVIFERARNWREAVGYSLEHSIQAEKRAGIVLILETPDDIEIWRRLASLIEHYGLPIDSWLIGMDVRHVSKKTIKPKPAEQPKPVETILSERKENASASDLDRKYLDILNENQAIYTYNIGLAYHRKGNYDRAIIEYTAALRLNPRFAKALQNRGAAWFSKGDIDRAINDFNQALNINAELAQASYNRGVAWERKGEFKKALADYKKAYHLEPGNEAYRISAMEMEKKAVEEK